MDKELRIVGICGNIPIDCPAKDPFVAPMQFLEYIMGDSGQICGAKYRIDLGHGYGFDNGTQVISINIDEEYKFEHRYTDTSDGTWEDGSYRVVVRLIEK